MIFQHAPKPRDGPPLPFSARPDRNPVALLFHGLTFQIGCIPFAADEAEWGIPLGRFDFSDPRYPPPLPCSSANSTEWILCSDSFCTGRLTLAHLRSGKRQSFPVFLYPCAIRERIPYRVAGFSRNEFSVCKRISNFLSQFSIKEGPPIRVCPCKGVTSGSVFIFAATCWS